MGKLISALIIGAVFGLGIALSGMINPAKVLNFFDVAGYWDPSLAFVMGGALTVVAIGYRIVLRRPAPRMAAKFDLPGTTRIDARLLGGAALFGIGWGLSGFCPGASLSALGTGLAPVLIFVAAMLVGLIVSREGQKWVLTRRAVFRGENA